MPWKIDKIKLPDKLNKRKKLTQSEKEHIQQQYKQGTESMRGLAIKYNVSKRTIQFAVYPERYKLALERRRKAWADGKYREYYDKEKQRQAIADIRKRKKQMTSQT